VRADLAATPTSGFYIHPAHLPSSASIRRLFARDGRAGRMGRVRVSFDVLRARGYASVREFGEGFIGVVTQGEDYHEFVRDSVMEATHAVREFCRRNDVKVSEIVMAARDGRVVEEYTERGE
jgi:hypothetical protein